jgi:hypothetical protein
MISFIVIRRMAGMKKPAIAGKNRELGEFVYVSIDK